MVAMVNGDEDFEKPSKFHSPRETMRGRKSTKDKDATGHIKPASTAAHAASSSSSSSAKKPLLRSYSEQKPPVSGGGGGGDRSNRSNRAGASVVSDVMSRTNNNDSLLLDQSFQSDASDSCCSDRTESSLTRSSSRGKGTISLAKPNRAFALRRALADGDTSSSAAAGGDTSTRGRSNQSSSPAASTRRSSSIHGTPRTAANSERTGTSTGRSEASLGAQIAKKARENTGGPPPRHRDTSNTRGGDGSRRGSQQGLTSNNPRRSSFGASSVGSASSASSAASSAKKERDIRALKTQLRSGPGSGSGSGSGPGGQKDLAIHGITGISSRSQSQPGSRSNSPKAAERMAWKRRKEYDPRRAVAEAKATKSKEPRPKPKVQVASSLYKQKMIRSSSFQESLALQGRTRHDTYSLDSTSSVEDVSSAAPTAVGPCHETGFQRAFIPFHSSLSRSDRCFPSEDDAGTLPLSQDCGGSSSGGGTPGRLSSSSHPVSLMLHKSAFTPPLSKLTTPSPDSPPQTLLLRRRTMGAVDYDQVGASSTAGSSCSNRSQADSHRSQHTPTSPQADWHRSQHTPTSPQEKVSSTHIEEAAGSSDSYDSLIVSSIYQLSLKLKTTTDKTLNKLREQERVSITPSPIQDFLGAPAKSEIPAWKSANQELAGVLNNLRKMEHHLHLMEKALFPEDDADTDISGMSTVEKQRYFQEIERIRSELSGFQPIDNPGGNTNDPGSPEMEEFARDVTRR